MQHSTATVAESSVRRRVLLVGLAEPLRDVLRNRLHASGHDTDVVTDARHAARYLRDHAPRLAIVDHRPAGGDAVALLRLLRAQEAPIAVVVIAQGGDSAEVARWLDQGADDCVGGTDALPELLARVRRILQQEADTAPSRLEPAVEFGPLRLDADAQDVRVGDVPLRLSSQEFHLLHLLARSGGRAVHVSELLRSVWGERLTGHEIPKKVLVAISRLRRSLAGAGAGVRVERAGDASYRLQ